MDLSQETKRKVMGWEYSQEKNPSVQKARASCNVGTIKQSNNSFSVKPPFPHVCFKLVLQQNQKLRQPPKACYYDNSQNEIGLFNCVQTLRCSEVVILNLLRRKKIGFDINLQISRLYVLSLDNYIFILVTVLVIFTSSYPIKQKITSALESEVQIS